MQRYFPAKTALLLIAIHMSTAAYGQSDTAGIRYIKPKRLDDTCSNQSKNRSDEARLLWYRGKWLAAPNGYINPWEISRGEEKFRMEDYLRALARNSARSGFDPKTGTFNPRLVTSFSRSVGFSFWWPSRDPVACNLGSNSPLTVQRAENDSESYIVQFQIEQTDISSSEGPRSTRDFRNLESLRRSTFFQEYNNGDMLAFLNCSTGRACDGWVWDKTIDISIFIFFAEHPHQSDPENFWVAPATASFDFVKQWLSEGSSRVQSMTR
ncbi:hypothetical protein [Stappia indica]|uniref:hypothetical protein n=1 Tax=Stappia indica TaxID=538381 RepID=UPI00082DAE46|nr:hypothetical protein [Stappia indica]